MPELRELPPPKVRRKSLSKIYSCTYSVAFNEEQQRIVIALTAAATKSFSSLVEKAFDSYLPGAYGVKWPRAVRVNRPSTRGRTSNIFGVLFTPPQDEVIRSIMRKYHVRFSELIEKSFADYIPKEYDIPWPTAPRLTKTG